MWAIFTCYRERTLTGNLDCDNVNVYAEVTALRLTLVIWSTKKNSVTIIYIGQLREAQCPITHFECFQKLGLSVINHLLKLTKTFVLFLYKDIFLWFLPLFILVCADKNPLEIAVKYMYMLGFFYFCDIKKEKVKQTNRITSLTKLLLLNLMLHIYDYITYSVKEKACLWGKTNILMTPHMFT